MNRHHIERFEEYTTFENEYPSEYITQADGEHKKIKENNPYCCEVCATMSLPFIFYIIGSQCTKTGTQPYEIKNDVDNTGSVSQERFSDEQMAELDDRFSLLPAIQSSKKSQETVDLHEGMNIGSECTKIGTQPDTTEPPPWKDVPTIDVIHEDLAHVHDCYHPNLTADEKEIMECTVSSHILSEYMSRIMSQTII